MVVTRCFFGFGFSSFEDSSASAAAHSKEDKSASAATAYSEALAPCDKTHMFRYDMHPKLAKTRSTHARIHSAFLQHALWNCLSQLPSPPQKIASSQSYSTILFHPRVGGRPPKGPRLPAGVGALSNVQLKVLGPWSSC